MEQGWTAMERSVELMGDVINLDDLDKLIATLEEIVGEGDA